MAEVMIVNPARRKRGKKRGRKKRKRARSTSTVTKTRTVYRNPRKKSRRRRRSGFRLNPRRGLFGGLNLFDLAGGTGIGIGSRLLPGLLARYGVPLPTTGYMSYLSQLGSGLALSYVADKFLKMKGIAKKGTEITIALVMTRAVNDLLLGGGGLSGLRGLGKRGAYLEGLRGRNLGQGVYEPAVSTGDSPTSRMMSRYGKQVQFRGARG